MLRIFPNNIAIQVLLILVALVALWWQPLVAPPTMAEDGAVLYDILQGWLSPLPRLAVIIAMILVFTEGVLLNLLLNNVGLVPQNTLLPTMLFVIMMSAMSSTLTPMILVTLFLLGFLNHLMLHSTLLTISTDKICSATMLIGICTLFYLPSLTFLITYLLVVISYRLYNWRDWAAMILGLLAPYVILITVLFVTDQLDNWWDFTITSLNGFKARFGSADTLPMIANILLVLIIGVSIFGLWIKLNEKTVIWQKNSSTVMLLTIGGVIMLFYSLLLPTDVSFFAIPFALCGTHLLTPSRGSLGAGRKKHRSWTNDILLLLTFIAALIC